MFQSFEWLKRTAFTVLQIANYCEFIRLDVFHNKTLNQAEFQNNISCLIGKCFSLFKIYFTRLLLTSKCLGYRMSSTYLPSLSICVQLQLWQLTSVLFPLSLQCVNNTSSLMQFLWIFEDLFVKSEFNSWKNG